mgnify:CR=1 FL=1
MLSTFFIVICLVILRPSNPKRKEYIFFEISEEKLPKEGVKKVDIKISEEKYFRIFLIKTENSLIGLSPVCTHLGCFVNFDKNSNEFLCPCHSGRFDIKGNVLAGPPKYPLQRLPIKIEDKKIFVGLKI